MDAESRDLAQILRELRSDVDGLWGTIRRRGLGGGGGGGTPGPPGTPAGFGTPGASATGLAPGANPTASVVASGPDTAKIFQFSFGIPAGQPGTPGGGGGNVLPAPATQFRYGQVAYGTDQWGDIVINFDTPFPSTCLLVLANVQNIAGGTWPYNPTANVLDRFPDRFAIKVMVHLNWVANSGALIISYIALGY